MFEQHIPEMISQFEKGNDKAQLENFCEILNEEIKNMNSCCQNACDTINNNIFGLNINIPAYEVETINHINIQSAIDSMQKPKFQCGAPCFQCKSDDTMYAQTKLLKTSELLLVHFQRKQDKPYYGKCNNFIKYPLNLTITNHNEDNQKCYLVNFNQISSYNLISVINHQGGGNGGHYTAYVQVDQENKKSWYLMNDQTVSTIPIEYVAQSGNAQVLLYQIDQSMAST